MKTKSGPLLTETEGSRCDGRKPQCSACVTGRILCNYSLPRKQAKQRLLKDKKILVALAKDLRLRVNHVERRKIDKALQEVGMSLQNGHSI